jgi:hypothetical protein
MPNGVGIEFANQNGGAIQSMAGAFDCLLCSAVGTNTTYGMLVTGSGGYIIRSNGMQWIDQTGLQLGPASILYGANGATIDVTYEILTGVGAVSGGTFWVTGATAVDDFGDIGTVTASAGVPSAVAITGSTCPVNSAGTHICAKTYLPAASAPGGIVWWHPTATTATITSATGTGTIATPFQAASETWAAAPSPLITLGGAAAVNLAGAVQVGGTAGVTCPSGVTAATVTIKNGIVTHC